MIRLETQKHELEPYNDRLKLVSVLVASDLDDKGILLKPEPSSQSFTYTPSLGVKEDPK